MPALQQKLSGLSREELQRALGVKPMDRSSKWRGVSKRKGRWEAKIALSRRWAYREAFDAEDDAARAHDAAMWRLRPRDARAYVNFKDSCPPDVAEALRRASKDSQSVPLLANGLPVTAKPLVDAGLLFDEDGVSIATSKHRLQRIVSAGELAAIGDHTATSSDPSGAHDHSGATGGGTPTALGAAGGGGNASGGASGAAAGVSGGGGGAASGGGGGGLAMGAGGGMGGRSASFTALSALDQQAAAAAAAPAHHHPHLAAHQLLPSGPPGGVPVGAFALGGAAAGLAPLGTVAVPLTAAGAVMPLGGGMHRVQSTPALHSAAAHQAFAMQPLQPLHAVELAGGHRAMQFGGSMQPIPLADMHAAAAAGAGAMQLPPGAVKLEGSYWSADLGPGGAAMGGGGAMGAMGGGGMTGGAMGRSRSCGNLALAGAGAGAAAAGGLAALHQQQQQQQLHHFQQQQQQSSEGSPLLPPPAFSGVPAAPATSGGGGGDTSSGGGAPPRPLLVRVGSEQHLIAPQPTMVKGMARIASEGHLASLAAAGGGAAAAAGQGSASAGGAAAGGEPLGAFGHPSLMLHHQQQLQQQHLQQQQQLLQQHQQQLGLLQQQHHQQQQIQQQQQRQSGGRMPRSHSVAVMGTLESIDEMHAAGAGGVGAGAPPAGMVPVGAGAPQPLLGPPPPGALPLGGLHGGYSHHPGDIAMPLAAAAAAPLPLAPLGGGDGAGGAGGGGAGGAGAPGSAAAAAAALAAGALDLGPPPEQPDSPFGLGGAVQIGGEDLDMALAFLSDGPGGGENGGDSGGAIGGGGDPLGGGAAHMDETAG